MRTLGTKGLSFHGLDLESLDADVFAALVIVNGGVEGLRAYIDALRRRSSVQVVSSVVVGRSMRAVLHVLRDASSREQLINILETESFGQRPENS